MSNNLELFQKNAKTTLPTFAKENTAGMGMENVGQTDMSTPTIKIMQALSPELQEDDELKPGQLYNTVTRAAYNELYVVSLYYDTSYSIFHKTQRQLVDRADSLQEATTKAEGLPGSVDDYDVQETKIQYMVALDIDDKGKISIAFPCISYFKKTQIAISNRWNTMIMSTYGDQTARWAGIWKFSTTKRSNTQGTWFVSDFEFMGYVQDKQMFDELTKTYEAISGRAARAA